MPLPVANMIDTLPTTGEKMAAKNLWNRSLPIAANVGIIEYNMVNEEKFREKVDEKYGEEWGRRLGDLARGLNEAAGVILGKHKGEELEGTVFDECSRKGKEPEGKTIELPERQGKKPEVNDSDETEPKAKEPKTKTLDHLAEACALAAQTGEKLPPALATINSLSAETGAKAKEPETKTLEQLAEACTLAAQTEEDIPSFLATTNSLSALWYLLAAFFTSGPCAASYYFVALEAAIRHCSTTIHPLYIPAPPTFWTAAANWTWPAVGLTLILTLASSEKTMFAAFARFSRSLSAPALTVDEMRTQTPSMSLRKAVLRAKDDAERKGRTTMLGVNLRDVGYSELFEIYGQKAVDKEGFATFARMFALGICPGGGAKLWLVGGGWGEVGTVWEGNQRLGAGVGEWEELDEFVKAFEGVVGVKVGPLLLSVPSLPSPSLQNPVRSLTSPHHRANGTRSASNGTTAASRST